MLRSAAARASRACIPFLEPLAAAGLASRLLRELGCGVEELRLWCPGASLPDMVLFLQHTGCRRLHISAADALAAAEADSLLPACAGVQQLTWAGPLCPDFLPPFLTELRVSSLAVPQGFEPAPQQVQKLLVRLRGAQHLHTLCISARLEVLLTAGLARRLPRSLRQVRVRVGPDDEDVAWSGVCGLDLGAFSRAAGCQAWLALTVVAWQAGPLPPKYLSARLLPALGAFRAADRLELCIMLRPDMLASCLASLASIACGSCKLCLSCPDGAAETKLTAAAITALPACQSRAIMQYDAERQPLWIEWAALSARPGVSQLGDRVSTFQGTVLGCTGEPLCGPQPWALVVWGPLAGVQGLPHDRFAEEQPGKHVWRNRAGALLKTS